jgi:predicted DNA-binding transcriptional regulator YafY
MIEEDRSGFPLGGVLEVGFIYVNWRGEKEHRRVDAVRIWFGSTKWHTESQWFLHGVDLEKQEVRDFAMKDMSDVVIFQ